MRKPKNHDFLDALNLTFYTERTTNVESQSSEFEKKKLILLGKI